MLGKWIVLDQVSNASFKVRCETCGIETQRRKHMLETLHRCPSIIDGQKYCYKCQRVQSTDFFHKDRTIKGGFSKVCRECYSERVGAVRYREGGKVERRTRCDDKTVSEVTTPIKNWCKVRFTALKNTSRRNNISFNLSEGYLFSLYEKQNGKCFYTGEPLYPHKGGIKPTTMSIDKLSPELGYVEGNVVLCLFCINSMKGHRTVDEFKDFLRHVIPNLQTFVQSDEV